MKRAPGSLNALKARMAAGFTLCAALGATQPAQAYCRSHTCKDTATHRCERLGRCVVSGRPLFRTSSCASYAVEHNGSPRHGVTPEHFDQLVLDAFERWLSVDCGGGQTPSIDIVSLGPVACDEVSYNRSSGNVSVFLFRDDDWLLNDADAFALATVWYERGTGEIYDVDVELNGTIAEFTTGDPQDGVDLASVLTHEVGHFLGLDHSGDFNASMRPTYIPTRDNLRTLRDDDIAGICEIYPPGRKTQTDRCLPRHGFARNCSFPALRASGGGCAQARSGASGSAPFVLAAALGLLGLRRARRQTAAGA